MEKSILLFISIIIGATTFAQDFGRAEKINNDWYFNLGDVQYGGREMMDSITWPVVDLPHDWTVKQNASPELASCTGYLPGGIAWYRKNLNIPAAEKGNKVYIYFEGVYNNSEVFINGKWVGKRPNGYISFMYDLTPYIKWGEDNSIAVRVDHSDDADSRWYTGSGIYRDVHLVYANPIHIDLWGVAYETTVKNNRATVKVNTTIKNTTDAANLKVVNTLIDAQGKTVASASKTGTAQSKTTSDFNQDLTLQSPSLWSIESPYLYTLKTSVYKGNKLIDESSYKAGIRSIDFDANKGFSLNGVNTIIQGVCIHHDAGVLGAAAYKSVWRTRLETLKSLGVNGIRMSHNPQATYLYELCDEMGFVVMDEAFDEWEYPKNKWIEGWNVGTPGHQGTSQYFREWSSRDVKDIVLRDRKHPSIIMWSIGNEVDYPNDPYTHPILADEAIGQQHVRAYLEDHPRAERLGDIAKELVAVVKEADKSRPVTAALAGAVMSNYTEYPYELDIVGYNYTESKYESDHKLYPNRVIYGSENRHNIGAWNAMKDKEYIFAQFLWTGIDYLGEAHAWPSRGYDSGLLDLAGNVKPIGYFRQSLWTDEPMAYIGTYIEDKNRRTPPWGSRLSTEAPPVWNYDEDTTVKVVCYTNCDEAELMLNGKVVGERKPYNPEIGIIDWDIAYAPGDLKVVAYKKGEEAATHTLETNTMPAAVKAEVLETIDDELVRQISIKILDTNGNLSVLADTEITCEVTGGTLMGMENASDNVAENYLDNVHRCVNGQMLIFVKKDNEDEPVSIKLSAPLMKTVALRAD